jgi:hypothetical protein
VAAYLQAPCTCTKLVVDFAMTSGAMEEASGQACRIRFIRDCWLGAWRIRISVCLSLLLVLRESNGGDTVPRGPPSILTCRANNAKSHIAHVSHVSTRHAGWGISWPAPLRTLLRIFSFFVKIATPKCWRSCRGACLVGKLCNRSSSHPDTTIRSVAG